jgi:hypothetical protein
MIWPKSAVIYQPLNHWKKERTIAAELLFFIFE